jgi:uncharacterized protein YjeT (DUF2065 family)
MGHGLIDDGSQILVIVIQGFHYMMQPGCHRKPVASLSEVVSDTLLFKYVRSVIN